MIEPKDGEWWMCDRNGVQTVFLRKCEEWRQDDNDTYDFLDVKPLYKMVKAGGMENLESDYERGMREAMKDIAKSCGKTFSVDIGYLELPKLVDELVNKEKPKPRTKVVYEHLTQSDTSVWDLREMLENGELFAKRSDNTYGLYSGNAECYMIRHFIEYGVYRKVEKEIDWKDELINKMGCGLVKANKDMNGYIVIGGVTFPDEVMIEMCHLVASLTNKPE